MTREAFRQVPTALDADPTIPAGAKALWRVLDDLARRASTVEATGPVLCRVLGCSPRALRLWREALVRAGWLTYRASDGGRGVPSSWTPLRRARRAVDGGTVAVDNRGRRHETRHETRHGGAASDLGNPATSCRVSAAPYKDRAREEEEAWLSGSVEGLPWCGVCDSDTVRWQELKDGRYIRCPNCNPQAVPAF